jgi:hypothetical protein
VGDDYYEVTVEDAHDSTIVLRVTSLNSNAWPPLETASFAINLLVDLWVTLVNEWPLGGSTLSAADAKASALSPPWASVLARLRDLAHGEQIAATPDDIAALENALRRGDAPLYFRGAKIAGWGSDGSDRHHVVRAADPEAFAAAASPLVQSCVHDEHEHQETYERFQRIYDPDDRDDPDDWLAKLPRERITLELTDPALWGFVRTGMRFTSRAYF